jgi:hypothetical protein
MSGERPANEPHSNNGETDENRPPVAHQNLPFEMVTVSLLEMNLAPGHKAATYSEIFACNTRCQPYTSSIWDGTSAQQKCYLYHGTRSVNLANFQTNGIRIKTFQPNDLDSVPVFYVFNHMEAAYEHLLVPYHRISGLMPTNLCRFLHSNATLRYSWD